MSIRFLILFIFSFNLLSCSVEHKPIDFGNDKCDFCGMTIVDNKFGSEIVNTKGKVYKFDAIECMIGFIGEKKVDDKDIALKLVTDYNKPGTFLDANKSYYLISENIQSPMGASLSAYSNESTVKIFKDKNDGIIYRWNDVFEKISAKNKKAHH
jgi:copper chaperone NosL